MMLSDASKLDLEGEKKVKTKLLQRKNQTIKPWKASFSCSYVING